MQEQTNLVQAISDIAAAMPITRTIQLYEFARFLESHPLPMEETLEEIAADETLWESQFAATEDDKLAELIAAVEAEISEGKTFPMFDMQGEFNEYK
ncbi:MAG: hypothetical protein KJZ86_00960 [Caldilineaceae bacterium]|nr:hypothetical protein [Caldilineaceae bacterium]